MIYYEIQRMFIRECFLSAILIIFQASAKMQDFTLNFDDILNENLMPAALMLSAESKDVATWQNLSLKKLDDEFECVTREKIRNDVGFLTDALYSMRFHRKMINEFLCSKFVAEKILEDIQPAQMRKRLGLAALSTSSSEIESVPNNSSSSPHNTLTKRMLYDEGSYQYKNWLAK